MLLVTVYKHDVELCEARCNALDVLSTERRVSKDTRRRIDIIRAAGSRLLRRELADTCGTSYFARTRPITGGLEIASGALTCAQNELYEIAGCP